MTTTFNFADRPKYGLNNSSENGGGGRNVNNHKKKQTWNESFGNVFFVNSEGGITSKLIFIF